MWFDAAMILLPVAALGGLWLLIRLFGDTHDNDRRKRAGIRLCIDCGYDLRGTGDQCPECGAFQPYCTACGNTVFRDNDETCPRCGRKSRFLTGQQHAHA